MKTGLIGNGYWGSIVQKKLEALSDLKFVANSKTDLSSVINSVDTVFVCSPTSTHYDIVMFCLRNNKNVFCEKPFTGSYNKAKELFEIAKDKGLNICVDHVFLYRDEYKQISDGNIIKFLWHKPEVINQNIVDSLLYHDLYMLINFTNCTEWNVKSKSISNEKLYLNLVSNNKNVEIEYDRNCTYKRKQVIVDGNVIDFSLPANDALYSIIEEMLNEKIDYISNNDTCLKTLYLKERII